MKVFKAMHLCDFEAWSGGKDTLKFLVEHRDDKKVEQCIEMMFENGIEEIDLNDFLWFDTDAIAQIFGFETWDEYVKDRKETMV